MGSGIDISLTGRHSMVMLGRTLGKSRSLDLFPTPKVNISGCKCINCRLRKFDKCSTRGVSDGI